MRKWEEKTTEAKREASAAKIKQEYLERVSWIRAVPEQKAYTDEVGTFMRWYFKEVNEHVNEFRLNRNFDDYLVELEEKGARKGGGDVDSAKDRSGEKKAAYESTKKLFDTFKSGQLLALVELDQQRHSPRHRLGRLARRSDSHAGRRLGSSP